MADTTTAAKARPKDFKVDYANDWCPGCGDFGILNAVHQALAKLNLRPHEVGVFGGIGCSGKSQYYVNAYGASTLHGRVLPYATGAKLANPELTVVAVGGDGDGMAIGAGHFVNTGRRNLDMTYILFNNEVYGLTKGQASPTLPLGLQTKSLPQPTIQSRVNPLMLSLAAGYTWIGRGYAFGVRQLVDLIERAISHPGLSFLEVLQPCPTYNDLHNVDWYAGKDLPSPMPRTYNINDEGYDPIVTDGDTEEVIIQKMNRFTEKANEWGDRIPIGVFLENKTLTFEDRITERSPSYRTSPPAKRRITNGDNGSVADLSSIMNQFAV